MRLGPEKVRTFYANGNSSSLMKMSLSLLRSAYQFFREQESVSTIKLSLKVRLR